MGNLLDFLSGKKTYIVALVAAALAFANSIGYVVPEWVFPLLGALGLATVRQAIAKVNQ